MSKWKEIQIFQNNKAQNPFSHLCNMCGFLLIFCLGQCATVTIIAIASVKRLFCVYFMSTYLPNALLAFFLIYFSLYFIRKKLLFDLFFRWCGWELWHLNNLRTHIYLVIWQQKPYFKAPYHSSLKLSYLIWTF